METVEHKVKVGLGWRQVFSRACRSKTKNTKGFKTDIGKT